MLKICIMMSVFVIGTLAQAQFNRTMICHTGSTTTADKSKPLIVNHDVPSYAFDPLYTKGGLKGRLSFYIVSKKVNVTVLRDYSNLSHGECGFQDSAMTTSDPAMVQFQDEVKVSMNTQSKGGPPVTTLFSDLGSKFNYDAIYSIPVKLDGNTQWIADNANVKKLK